MILKHSCGPKDVIQNARKTSQEILQHFDCEVLGHYGFELVSLSGVPDYFDRNKISSGGDLSHYSSASLY